MGLVGAVPPPTIPTKSSMSFAALRGFVSFCVVLDISDVDVENLGRRVHK